MTRTFDGREMMRVAVQDERSGVRLYERLAGQESNTALAAAFRDLACQEAGHAERFQRMLTEMGDAPADGRYPDEYVDYLETLVAEGGQHPLESMAAEAGDGARALDLAEQFERGQLALQADMARVVGETYATAAEAIITEERSHLVRLAQLRKQLR